MERVFSGVQSSGAPHIGNYFGAFRQWVADQHKADSVFCVVDLHALTIEHDPTQVGTRALETASWLFASGSTRDLHRLRAKPRTRAHCLELVARVHRHLRRAQAHDPVQGEEQGQRVCKRGLFTYPVLMAADILLYDTNKVPVGDDQRQHLELARDIAIRFNGRYGDTFVVPEAAVPKVAARVMDLQHPERKMSKSVTSPLGLST